MRINTLFLAIVVLALSTSCDRAENRKEAYEDVVAIRTFQDTLLTYSLSSDSLVVTFVHPLNMKRWYGEVYLVRSNPQDEIRIPFPNHKDGNLGYLTIEQNTIRLGGFHIPKDSLNRYHVTFHAVPTLIGCYSWGEVFGPMFLFKSDESGSGTLKMDERVTNLEIVSVDLVKLKQLSPELRQFCRDSIEQVYGRTITDAEIEESKYAFR